MEDFNSKYTGEGVESILDSVGGKQDAISDLEAIRSGAEKGTTAVQPASLANYVSKDDVDAALSETSANPIQNQAVMNTLLEWEAVLIDLFAQKQPVISDLETIREGAAKGATSVQPSDIEDVARKDSNYVIANGILDENDDYWHLPKNSLNDKEHTLASKSDIEEKILVIGDSSDEAKANFTAVANGEKTADVYIGSVDVEGYIIEGCVKLAMSGSSSNRMYDFTIIGTPTSGRYINKFIKVTCLFANGAISSEVNVIDAYSKPSTGIPATDLASDVQSALVAAEAYKGTVTNIKINGSTKSPTNGIVDLGIIGTYSKPSTGIPKSDLASDVQTTLDNAATFVVAAFDLSAIYSGDDIVYPGKDVLMNAIREGKAVRIPFIKDSLENGYVIAQAYYEDMLYMTIEDGQNIINIETPMSDPMLYASDITIHEIANRAAIEKVEELEVVVAKGVNDGASVYATPTSANGDEDDILLSRDTVKTINGKSIVGSGDIEISGGSGEQGPQGDKGDKGDKGDTGTGVQSVKQTTISNTDGGSNVVTVTLTNGATSTFTVKNGSKGSNGTNGTNGKDGADGATFTPSVDSAGNLSWTNNKGLTNPPTVNIKGPKGDKGDAGEGGGSGGGGGSSEKEVVNVTNGVIEVIEPNKIYILDGGGTSLTFEIQSIAEPDVSYAEYCVIIHAREYYGGSGDIQPSISLPEGLRWANESTPDMSRAGVYELNIVYFASIMDGGFNAVLTRFEYIE